MKLPELKTLPTQEEVDGLKAQVEQLRLWADRLSFELAHDDNYEVGHTFCKLQDALAATPAQCLAEVRAQTVDTLNNLELFHLIKTYGSKDCAYKVQESLFAYANQLRQQSQEQK